MSEIIEFVDEVEGIHFRSILIRKAGTLVPQHEHDVSHPTLCGQGSASIYLGTAYWRDIKAGEAVPIKAGVVHSFMALEDDTRLTCVFDAERALKLKQKGF